MDIPPDMFNEISVRLAKLEGLFASHWALRPRTVQIRKLRSNLKQDSLLLLSKIFAAGAAIAAGIGIILVQTFVSNALSDAGRRYERIDREILGNVTRKFEWERFHSYGDNYRHLAELYYAVTPSQLVQPRIISSLNIAGRFYRKAIRIDSSQSSSHWEIGDINYEMPKKFKFTNYSVNQAYIEYQKARGQYTLSEIQKGWRAECDLQLASICCDRIEAEVEPGRKAVLAEELQKLVGEAEDDIQGLVSTQNPTKARTRKGEKEGQCFLDNGDDRTTMMKALNDLKVRLKKLQLLPETPKVSRAGR